MQAGISKIKDDLENEDMYIKTRLIILPPAVTVFFSTVTEAKMEMVCL